MNSQLLNYIPKPWFSEWLNECNLHFGSNYDEYIIPYKILDNCDIKCTIANVFSWEKAKNPDKWEYLDNTLFYNNEEFKVSEIKEFYDFVRDKNLTTLEQVYPELYL